MSELSDFNSLLVEIYQVVGQCGCCLEFMLRCQVKHELRLQNAGDFGRSLFCALRAHVFES